MRKLMLSVVLVLASGLAIQAQAPTPSPNAAVSWATVCSWDVGCLTYKILKGVWTLWK